MSQLRPISSLDELAADPTKAVGLSPEVRGQMITRCAAVLAALSGTMLANEVAAEPMPGPPPGEESNFTAEQVAKRLNVRTAFVYELRRRGELPFVLVGKRYLRFPITAVQEWEAKQLKSAGLTRARYVTYQKRNDRRGASKDPKEAGLEPIAARHGGRCDAKLDRSAGARGDGHA
jgi:excisionase family DNA binding protein